jgi:hypothetical protein
MENTDQNGYKNPRMDRIERTLEMLVADHVAFRDEHKQLLTSQILLTDQMDKLTGTMQELAESQKATDGRMTVLIGMMDTFIRERGGAR